MPSRAKSPNKIEPKCRKGVDFFGEMCYNNTIRQPNLKGNVRKCQKMVIVYCVFENFFEMAKLLQNPLI